VSRLSRQASDAEAAGWAEPQSAQPLTLLEALAVARRTVSMLTDCPVDGIAQSARRAEGGWRVVVDAIEAPARMGDNDLLSAHEVLLAADGELEGFSRLRRYHREDGDLQ